MTPEQEELVNEFVKVIEHLYLREKQLKERVAEDPNSIKRRQAQMYASGYVSGITDTKIWIADVFRRNIGIEAADLFLKKLERK